jgi:cell wall-associated NlpC family hydrolase
MSSPFESLICPPGHDVLQTTRQFLHTPYVWGGRSTFGFDCSGLVQTVYHIHRKNLPRDASQQFLAGDKVPVLQEAEPGDLAFFAGKSGKISHVGILDGLGNILHCSGKVRIDHITEEGIRHADSRDLTHRLAGIKRLPG